jgi:hypothetical protein
MPLAPNWTTVFSAVPPVLEQSVGTASVPVPMTCIGISGADSPVVAVSEPPICTSAVTIGPQLYPSTNYVHSASDPPLTATGGSALSSDELIAEEIMRTPCEPVST